MRRDTQVLSKTPNQEIFLCATASAQNRTGLLEGFGNTRLASKLIKILAKVALKREGEKGILWVLLSRVSEANKKRHVFNRKQPKIRIGH